MPDVAAARPTAGVAARRVGDRGEVDRAGVAVEQREAVQEERRGERAEQEVLQRRLLREQPAPPGQPAIRYSGSDSTSSATNM